MSRDCIGKFKAPGCRLCLSFLMSLITLFGGGCAASREPSAARPRGNEAPYPVILAANADRREQALAAWAALARDQNLQNEPAPQLQPVTATISALPASDAPSLRLPLVEIKDAGGVITEETKEEALRESLRRFIASANALLGVAPQNLSLVERKDDENGTGTARYQQQPFPHPLRAGFGVLEIVFTPDRRILSVSSTAIPETERLSRALTGLRPQQLSADQAIERLRGRSFTFPGLNSQQTYTIAANDSVVARELVIYPVRPPTEPGALQLHLAWEMSVGPGDAPFLVYLDAVTGEIITAAPTQSAQTAAEQKR